EASAAVSILHAEHELREPGERHYPRNLRADASQSVGTKQPAIDEWRIGEIPHVWMLRVDAAKRGEELAALDLEAPRQRRRLHERFLGLNFGFVLVVEFEDDVREALEIRVDGAIERNFE